MSDFGIFASRLQINNETLKEFEDSLRYLRKRKEKHTAEQDEYHLQKIKNVIEPIVEDLKGNLSNTMLIDDRNIVEILRLRKIKTWPFYQEDLIKLSAKIHANNLELNQSDIVLLNDIADAMEIECSKLFKRMRRFP